MIKLLPVTALHYNLPTNPNDHYNLPTNPNELDIYIEMDDKTAKELSSQTHAVRQFLPRLKSGASLAAWVCEIRNH